LSTNIVKTVDNTYFILYTYREKSKEEKVMSLKKRILEQLESHRGETLSGQQLADSLSVSRNSVWKAIKALQGEGYSIEASTNKGYAKRALGQICMQNTKTRR